MSDFKTVWMVDGPAPGRWIVPSDADRYESEILDGGELCKVTYEFSGQMGSRGFPGSCGWYELWVQTDSQRLVSEADLTKAVAEARTAIRISVEGEDWDAAIAHCDRALDLLGYALEAED